MLSYSSVDGHWSNWADWSGCSVTCGAGSRSRDRKCDNPSPANGGDNCTDGVNSVVENCTMPECSGITSRDYLLKISHISFKNGILVIVFVIGILDFGVCCFKIQLTADGVAGLGGRIATVITNAP